MTRMKLHAHAHYGAVELIATMRIQNHAGSGIKVAVAESDSQAAMRCVCVIRTIVGQHFN